MGKMVDYSPSFFKGKNIFITGDSGFKGSWLSLILWYYGANVTGYSLPAYTEDDHFFKINLSDKIKHIDGDILDKEYLYSSIEESKPDIVFHLAAQPLVRLSYSEPVKTFETNVLGSINLLECVRSVTSVKSLVYVTSDKCYKNNEWIWGYRESDELGGHDPYSASKAAAEIVFNSYRLSFYEKNNTIGVASVRAGNVIGGGDWSSNRIIPDCIRALNANDAIVIRSPAATRPWQHVLEPLSGYMRLAFALYMEPKSFSGAWNFGPDSASHKNVKTLVETVINSWGSGELKIDEAQAEDLHEAGFLHLNCDKAHNYLGWNPVWNFYTTIQETVGWYKAANKESKSLEQINMYFNKGNKND